MKVFDSVLPQGEMDNADESLGKGSSGTNDGAFARRSCSRSRTVDASPSGPRESHSSHNRAEGEENEERIGVSPGEPPISSSFLSPRPRDQKAGGSDYRNHAKRIQVTVTPETVHGFAAKSLHPIAGMQPPEAWDDAEMEISPKSEGHAPRALPERRALSSPVNMVSEVVVDHSSWLAAVKRT